MGLSQPDALHQPAANGLIRRHFEKLVLDGTAAGIDDKYIHGKRE
jgi:hypothetical protein